MTEFKNKSWKNPIVIIAIGTALIGLAGFFVKYHIQPLNAQVKILQAKTVEMKKEIEKRPTENELKPEFEYIKKEIIEIKDTQKEIYRLLLKTYTRSDSK